MLNFEKIILHNFGSYGHAEVDLKNRGFCLVTGKNNYKKDNAISNGSGKSFLWNAICFALVGETLNGLHSNLKNINIVDDTSCYVTLIFMDGNDTYQITRHITPRSDLKIIKNDIDVSGKGIRESEKKLIEFLPDLTKNLITSTIIIGQGMPNKFSSFSPSGRKELLEKLTRADFMIEDIKVRVSARQTELSNQIRSCEDALLANQSQLAIFEANLKTQLAEITNITRPNFEEQLTEISTILSNTSQKISEKASTIASQEANLIALSDLQSNIHSDKTAALSQTRNAYDEASGAHIQKQALLSAEIRALSQEISQLKAIKDTCPTCGQKIPGTTKPSTRDQEQRLVDLQMELSSIQAQLTDYNKQYQKNISSVDAKYEKELSELKARAATIREQLTTTKSELRLLEQQYTIKQELQTRLKFEKETWSLRLEQAQKNIQELENSIQQISQLMTLREQEKLELQEHLKIVKKMDTLIKRDFRGFLLTNIISYIDKKAKEYSNTVFGTKELEVALDGNDLNISYCGKMFDNLSGGEKQRVDLILQFTIRNMLTAYLNFNSNILVLDEITDFLDKKSCAAVLNLITDELNTIESVFIVSHHASELALPIDSELIIKKNELGISEIIAGA